MRSAQLRTSMVIAALATAAPAQSLDNVLGSNRPLVILSGTTDRDPYYGGSFEHILAFQAALARAALANGDNAIVFADRRVAQRYRAAVGCRNCVIEEPMDDIWSRDFGIVHMKRPTMMEYYNEYLSSADSRGIQRTFKQTLQYLQCNPSTFIRDVDLALDGGNVVDNFADKAVLTRRVLTDNRISESQAKRTLGNALNYDVCLVPDLGDTTGHSDGMVSFIDTDTIAITDTLTADEKRRTLNDLKQKCGWTDLQYVTLPSHYGATQQWRGFDSACGLHINALLTERNLYVPVFGGDGGNAREGQSAERDERVLAVMRHYTTKNVVPVRAPHEICRMGGSVRCLTMAVQGPLAECLVDVAQRYYSGG